MQLVLPPQLFLNWYKERFGHDFNGVSDEDCDLEICWKMAYQAGQKDPVWYKQKEK